LRLRAPEILELIDVELFQRFHFHASISSAGPVTAGLVAAMPRVNYERQ
jgi:hypothetical protein